ncbi:MAG: Gfo/Idh/MocA family protein [Phycisphaerales bacterium JB059]
MSDSGSVGVGVIGAGFIGQTHLRAFAGVRGGRVAGVCDANPARLLGRGESSGNLGADASEKIFDPATIWTGGDPLALIEHPEVDLVCVCTPTDTHVDLAQRALDAGKHVLVEKPVAISSQRVRELRDHAASVAPVCVPAMCVRFWPGWDTLPARIRSGEHGECRSVRFTRVGASPAWSPFYADPDRSGDALFDLHVHDVDMVHQCFGPPARLHSTGSTRHVVTTYEIEGHDTRVVAEGGWVGDPETPFRMRYEAVFERAQVLFDLGRTPPLRMLRGEQEVPLETRSVGGWDIQASRLIDAIRAGVFDHLPTLDEALRVTETLEAERESLQTGAPIEVGRR